MEVGVDMRFEFYVLNYHVNKHRVEMFNIFDNYHVQKHTEKAVKKYLRNPKNFTYKSYHPYEKTFEGFEALVKEIDSIICWQEFSRVEYECSAGYAFETDCNKLQKIDCYYQAHANIRTITHEVIRQYKQQLKENKKNVQ